MSLSSSCTVAVIESHASLRQQTLFSTLRRGDVFRERCGLSAGDSSRGGGSWHLPSSSFFILSAAVKIQRDWKFNFFLYFLFCYGGYQLSFESSGFTSHAVQYHGHKWDKEMFFSCLNTYSCVIYRVLILEEGLLVTLTFFFILHKPIFGHKCLLLQRDYTGSDSATRQYNNTFRV